jgi:hypothetical protein
MEKILHGLPKEYTAKAEDTTSDDIPSIPASLKYLSTEDAMAKSKAQHVTTKSNFASNVEEASGKKNTNTRKYYSQPIKKDKVATTTSEKAKGVATTHNGQGKV